jgi:hypothetical protein
MTYFTLHMAEMLKVAKRGPAETYMPWYGAAGLGGTGAVLAQEAAPKRLKIPAAIAGSLVGTGVGVHGGERLGRALDKLRKAKEKKAAAKKEPTPGALVGAGLAGLGLGTAGGYGAGKLLERAARKSNVPMARLIPAVVSTAGGVLGVSYPLWKAYEQAAMQRSIASRRRSDAR